MKKKLWGRLYNFNAGQFFYHSQIIRSIEYLMKQVYVKVLIVSPPFFYFILDGIEEDFHHRTLLES